MQGDGSPAAAGAYDMSGNIVDASDRRYRRQAFIAFVD
jgi:hypothetical protein